MEEKILAQINEVIDGKYEILREIGRGGMSVVYLAMDKRLNKQWAVKEFRKDEQDENNRVNLESLLHEANIMKKLDHPTLPRIVDIIDDSKSVYIVMDYIEGEPLSKVLEASGAQPQDVVIDWAKQLAEVLDYLHTQNPPVIYRDMKPANIMLKPDNTIRVFDFGIAREYKEGKDGDTIALGTRGYAAPEQFGDSQTDARTDIYSFGVTLYHLLTGKNPSEPPYEIYPIRHWNPSLSSGLEWLIQKCTQLNPNDRYQSFAEVTYVLENLEKFEGAYKKKQRSRINAFMTTAILTLVFTLCSFGFLFGASAEQKKTYQSKLDLNTVAGYEEAIEIDEENTEAYIQLAKKLREEINVIYSVKPENRELYSNEILSEKIETDFSNTRLESIKEDNKSQYVSINYELGRLYWNYFVDASGQQDVGVSKSMGYFEKVITTAKEMEEENGTKYGGLSEQKYNLAKSYYLVSFFQSKRASFSNEDDGEFYTDSNGIAEYAGVYGLKDDHTFENPYYSFWITDKQLLSLVSGENDVDVDEKVKFETLKRLAYITNENYSDFYKSGQVKAEEMEEFFSEFGRALSNLENGKIEQKDIDQVKKQVNSTIGLVNAQYKSEISKIS